MQHPSDRNSKLAKSSRRGAIAISGLVPDLTRKAFEKYGFSCASLLTDWERIVGSDLAGYTRPEKLKWPQRPENPNDSISVGSAKFSDRKKEQQGATLLLRVDGPKAVEIQYRGTQILERINAYFGYRAVSELRVLQAPLPICEENQGNEYQELPPLTAEELHGLAPELNAIQNERLREALSLMAAGVKRRRKPRDRT